MPHHTVVILGLTVSEWAAWVQAIGTVAAVYGAFWLHRHRLDVDRRKQVGNILAVVKATEEFTATLKAAFDGPGGAALETALIETHGSLVINAFLRALHEIPVQDVGVPAGVVALLSLRIQVEILGKEIESFRDLGKTNHATAAATVLNTLAKITADCRTIHRVLDARQPSHTREDGGKFLP